MLLTLVFGPETSASDHATARRHLDAWALIQRDAVAGEAVCTDQFASLIGNADTRVGSLRTTPGLDRLLSFVGLPRTEESLAVVLAMHLIANGYRRQDVFQALAPVVTGGSVFTSQVRDAATAASQSSYLNEIALNLRGIGLVRVGKTVFSQTSSAPGKSRIGVRSGAPTSLWRPLGTRWDGRKPTRSQQYGPEQALRLTPLYGYFAKAKRLTALHEGVSFEALSGLLDTGAGSVPALPPGFDLHLGDPFGFDGGFEVGAPPQPLPAIPDDFDPQEEGFVRIDFEDEDERRVLTLDEGLTTSAVYRITVDLLREAADPRQRGSIGSPLRKPSEDVVELVVALLPRTPNVRVEQTLSTLRWGPGHSTRPAEFIVSALQAGVARVDVYIHRDFDLVFAAAVRAEIRAPGEPWAGQQPIGWTDDTGAMPSGRSRAFRKLSRLLSRDCRTARAVCVAVQADGSADSFLITVLAKGAELPLRVRLSRGELENQLIELRRALDRLRREPVMLDGGYDPNGAYAGIFSPPDQCRRSDGRRVPTALLEVAHDAFLRRMATIGRGLRAKLFEDEAGQLALRAIRSHAPPGSVVQIWLERTALDFAFPWAWIYDGTFDPEYDTKIEVDLFWGQRLIIEQVVECLEPPLRERENAVINGLTGLRIRAGTFNFHETAQHCAWLEALPKRTAARTDVKVWDEDLTWENYLPVCDADVLYFFTHGHTALPKTASSAETYDATRALRDWLSEPVTEEESETQREVRKRFAETLDRLIRHESVVDRHHIQLATGYLFVEDLRKLRIQGGRAPLVILNMCESAQIYPSVSDGLVHIFLSRGALGVIGTEMPMVPQFADLFGRLFLERLLRGEAVGAILLALRRHFMAAGNPLASAYTHYGDALLRIDPALLPNESDPAS